MEQKNKDIKKMKFPWIVQSPRLTSKAISLGSSQHFECFMGTEQGLELEWLIWVRWERISKPLLCFDVLHTVCHVTIHESNRREEK